MKFKGATNHGNGGLTTAAIQGFFDRIKRTTDAGQSHRVCLKPKGRITEEQLKLWMSKNNCGYVKSRNNDGTVVYDIRSLSAKRAA